MKKLAAGSIAILLAVISVAMTRAQAPRGAAVPQMRGDGPPPAAKSFSITRNDPEHVGAQTRSGRSHVLLIGPSCTGMDHQGRVIWCADNDRQVMRLEKDGTHTVLSGGMNGQRFSGPNDIAIAADDAVYVTDND